MNFTAFKVRVFCSKQTVESELTTSIYLIRAHVANAKTRSNMSEAAAPAKKKAAAKKAAPDHPKYEVMIASAIDTLKSRKGSSRAAIKKHIEANYKVGDNANVHLKLALKRGVGSGVFTQVKGAGANGSFKNAPKAKPAKATKKPAKSPKKAKKPAAKKAVVKKVTAKPAAKSPKKAKKPAAKKPAAKKTKKPAAKKPAAKKAAVKKTPKKGGKKAKK